jgi:hypothetical protein
MNTWHWMVFALGCLAALGCRTDPRITALEQESRLQEDRIYELQNCLEDAQASLESYRQESEALRGGAARNDGGSEPTPEVIPNGVVVEPKTSSEPRTSPERKPARRPGTTKPPAPNELPKLEVEIPPPSKFRREIPETLKQRIPTGEAPPPESLELPPMNPGPLGPAKSGEEAPRFLPGTNGGAGSPPPSDTPVGADPASARVGSIALADLLTGAFDADGRPGDDGLSIFVQPRDADGRLVGAAAPISVVAIDPALSGEAARVARWDLSPEQIAAMYQKTGSAEGFHLELRWPDGVPVHDELRLYVRYTTADGRKLHAERAIEVAPGPARSFVAKSAPSDPTWRAKQFVEQPAPAVVPSPRLETPSPPPTRPDAPVAQSPSRPVWSPDRR